jgi:hypothetical protein
MQRPRPQHPRTRERDLPVTASGDRADLWRDHGDNAPSDRRPEVRGSSHEPDGQTYPVTRDGVRIRTADACVGRLGETESPAVGRTSRMLALR